MSCDRRARLHYTAYPWSCDPEVTAMDCAAHIRQTRDLDVKAICAIDHVAPHDLQRRQFIREAVSDGNAYVAEVSGQVVGYAVLEHSFFGRGFVAMLLVHAGHRRAGIGSALIHHLEGLCQSDRLFVSTNQSNQPMQALLARLGYAYSGQVDHLDPGDPELFYSKSPGGDL